MKIKSNITEAELQHACALYFKLHGFLIREEVPFLLKMADIYCFHEGTGECLAIEVKVRNWQRALEQALVYQMMADKVYIAMSQRYANPVDKDLLRTKGVGLLTIDESGNVSTIVEAPISVRRIPYFISSTVATAFPGTDSVACLML